MDQGPYQPHFNLCEFFGEWQVIASIPTDFDPPGYPAHSKYKQPVDTGFNMYTWSYDLEGKEFYQGHGFARIDNWKQPTRIVVNYPGLPPASQPNFIIHKTDYCNFALIGSYDRSTFAILSRHKTISEKHYQQYLAWATSWGYDASKVVPKQGAIWSKHN